MSTALPPVIFGIVFDKQKAFKKYAQIQNKSRFYIKVQTGTNRVKPCVYAGFGGLVWKHTYIYIAISQKS